MKARGNKISDSIPAVRCSLLSCISFYMNAECYESNEGYWISDDMGQSGKHLNFHRAGSSLVCTFMLIPGKELVLPYFLGISLQLLYCLGALVFLTVFYVLFSSTFCLCKYPQWCLFLETPLPNVSCLERFFPFSYLISARFSLA